MPATSRGKIYNSLQLGNLFHLFSHKGLWSGSGNYRDNCLSKASRLASDQSVPPEQKRGKRFSVVSTTPPNSRAVSAPWGNSVSAFHFRTPTLPTSLPPSWILLSKLAKKHSMPVNKKKKTSIKSLWNKASAPQHNAKQQKGSVWFSSWPACRQWGRRLVI